MSRIGCWICGRPRARELIIQCCRHSGTLISISTGKHTPLGGTGRSKQTFDEGKRATHIYMVRSLVILRITRPPSTSTSQYFSSSSLTCHNLPHRLGISWKTCLCFLSLKMRENADKILCRLNYLHTFPSPLWPSQPLFWAVSDGPWPKHPSQPSSTRLLKCQ